MKRTNLKCSCCGNNVFKAYQSPQHDQGYGTCNSCLNWQLNRQYAQSSKTETKRLNTLLQEQNQ